MSISVVIPAYNAAGFIAQTLESVLGQTLPPDEVLVIDDGSTDSTAEVAERFGAPVRVIRRANVRQAASRNFGVQEAAGEWVAFVDADDLWEPHKLARQMEELARNPAASLCYTARVEFVEQGGTIQLGKVVPVPPPEGIRGALYRNTTFLPSSVLLRRSAFLAAGGFDTQFKIAEDWDLWLRLLHSGIEFAACQEPLLLYRIHPQSVSHNAMPGLAECKEIYRRDVLPRLPRATRWWTHQKAQSGLESTAAFVLRKVGDPRCLAMMTTSIVRYPFHQPHRYKVLAHMVYTSMRRGRRMDR
jgi:glycosyltransferase involved in cell wall biosynthesis